MSGEGLFFLVLFLNLLVSAVYLLASIFVVVPGRHKAAGKERRLVLDNRRTILLRFLVMVLCPVVGPLYFMASYALYRVLFHREADLEDVGFSKERVKSYVKADSEREQNIAPIEEGLAVTDNQHMRQLMLNVIKTDIESSLSSISLALKSSDSETSHYAASVLQNVLNDFRVNVQKLKNLIEEESEKEMESEKMLFDYMEPILAQHVFHDMEQKRFVHILDETAESMFTKDPQKAALGVQSKACRNLLDIGDYKEAEKWCRRMQESFPDALETWRLRLRLCFESGRKEEFFATLDALKHSNVVIDQSMLELIRAFSAVQS